MNILVTGGAGYIGSHMAKLLRRHGHVPIVYDDLSTGHREFVRFGPFVEGDIRDEERLTDALRRYAVEAAIHFAGMAIVGESMRLPDAYRSVNTGGTGALLRAMRIAGADRIVFSSTCAVYGVARSDRIAEDHVLDPVNPYGESKLQAEQAIRAAAADWGLKWACLRYFNVIGGDPEGEVGERHEPETHLLPNLLAAALEGGAFSQFGDAHATPDGTAVRDYVDVHDLVAVHLEALDRLKNSHSLVSNVGGGRGYSVREVREVVERVTGRRVHVEVHPARPGDPPRLVADHAFLQRWSAGSRMGFRPLADSIRDLLRSLEQRRGSASGGRSAG